MCSILLLFHMSVTISKTYKISYYYSIHKYLKGQPKKSSIQLILANFVSVEENLIYKPLHLLHICDPIEQNEPNVGNIDFQIHPIMVCYLFCMLLFCHILQINVMQLCNKSCIDIFFTVSECSVVSPLQPCLFWIHFGPVGQLVTHSALSGHIIFQIWNQHFILLSGRIIVKADFLFLTKSTTLI